MPRKPWTPDEIARAKRLYEADRAKGCLKPPRAIVVAAFSDGSSKSLSAATDWRRYLPDARRAGR
jgi:hypothetical protein